MTEDSSPQPEPQVAHAPLAGVIGWPIAHSRSPALHGHWLRRYDLPGYYIPIPVRPENLAEVLHSLPRMGFVGVNVTIPHKEAVLQIADIVTDRAALIGAGGAARAVVASLLESGVPELRITNRTKLRAEQIRNEFGAKVVVYDWAQAGNMLEGATTVVNATSMGMVGKQALRVPLDALSPGTLVTDLVYTPLMTDFQLEAQSRGCQVVDGLGMLLHQAAPGFERWFGRRPEVDEALQQAVL